MPYASLGGRRFYYEVGGGGGTGLLLHGSVSGAGLLEAPATAVSSGLRALRFDRRGHGRSSDAHEPLSLADEAAEMAALLDWFSTEKTHLLAHDDGAEVAIQFALDFPARTLSLALLAPTLEGFPWRDQTLAERRDFLSVFARSPRAAIEAKWLTSPAFDVVRAREGPFERLQALYGPARVAGGSLARPAHPGPTQVERLGEIRTRPIVLAGRREDSQRACVVG